MIPSTWFNQQNQKSIVIRGFTELILYNNAASLHSDKASLTISAKYNDKCHVLNGLQFYFRLNSVCFFPTAKK